MMATRKKTGNHNGSQAEATKTRESLSTMQLIMSESRKLPRLEREEEREMILRARAGDQEAFRQLTLRHAPFVLQIARRLSYKSDLPLEDLFNIGLIGLFERVHKFDLSRGTRFLTYASWWIRRKMGNEIARTSRTIRIPNYLLTRLKNLNKQIDDLKIAYEKNPQNQSLAHQLDAKKVQRDKLLQEPAFRYISHLDDLQNAETGQTVGEEVADDTTPNPLTLLLGKEASENVRAALTQLSPLDRRIIELRFGLNGKKILTLREIGEKVGVSRERIRQRETISIVKLKRLLSPVVGEAHRQTNNEDNPAEPDAVARPAIKKQSPPEIEKETELPQAEVSPTTPVVQFPQKKPSPFSSFDLPDISPFWSRE